MLGRVEHYLDQVKGDEELGKFLYSQFWYSHHISALYLNLSHKWRWASIAHYAIYLFSTLYAILSFFKATLSLIDYDLALAAQSANITCVFLALLPIIAIFPLYRSSFVELMTINKCNYYIDYEEQFIYNQIDVFKKDLSKFNMKLAKTILAFVTSIAFIVLVGIPFIDKYQGITNDEPYIKDVYMHLPIPMYFPFIVNNVFIRVLCILYEMLITTMGASICGSALVILTNIIQEVNLQMRILLYSVENLEKRALNRCKKNYPTMVGKKNSAELYKDKLFIKEYKICIKYNIQHHQTIISRAYHYVNLLQKWPLFFVLLLLSGLIALALFIAMKGTTRLGPQVFSFVLLLFEILIVALVSLQGQDLIDLSQQLFYAFYFKSQWYYCPKSVKTSMMICQERCKHLMHLRAGGFTSLDWELFSAIMNTSYTYFNLLRAGNEHRM